jgi:hypothetical protein
LVAAVAVVAALGGYLALRTGGEGGPTTVSESGAAGPSVESAAEDGATIEPVVPDAIVVNLSVTSTPPGAAVSLDGEDTGAVTPASFPMEEPYPRAVELMLDGYDSATQEVPPVEGEPVAVAFELTRTPTFGRVVLSASYAFEVWQGNERLGALATDHDLTRPTGSATLRVRSPEYFLNRRFAVEIVDGGRELVTVPTLGSLTVFSNPGNCEIFVGEQSLGFPPVSRREAAPGTYTVSRLCPNESDNSEEEVTVTSDAEARVALGPGPG